MEHIHYLVEVADHTEMPGPVLPCRAKSAHIFIEQIREYIKARKENDTDKKESGLFAVKDQCT